MAKPNTSGTFQKPGQQAKDAKAKADQALIDARALATQYQVTFTDLDKVDAILAKVEEAKKNGVTPEGEVPPEIKGSNKAGLGVKKEAKKEELEDKVITSPEELHELQESKKLHGFTGWYTEKEVDGEIIQSPAKNQQGEYGFVTGAKAIVRVLASFLLGFMCLFGSQSAFAARASDDTGTLGADQWYVQADGDILPGSDSDYDLGEVGSEIRAIYADTFYGDLESTGDVTFNSTLFANGRTGASSYLASSSTSLGSSSAPYSIVLKSIGNNPTAEATSLPNGTPGQMLTLQVISRAGGSWTVTPVKKTGWNSINYAAAGQQTTLLYLNDTLGWIILNNGSSASVALATVSYNTTP